MRSIQHYIRTLHLRQSWRNYCRQIGPSHLFHPPSQPPTADFTRGPQSKRHREPQRLFAVLFITLSYTDLPLTFLKTVYSHSCPITRLKRGSQRSHELLMRAAPKHHSLFPASSLPSVLMCPLSIRQSKQQQHCGRFSLQDLRSNSAHGASKAGRWRERPNVWKPSKARDDDC